jgi:hypothetical protein
LLEAKVARLEPGFALPAECLIGGDFLFDLPITASSNTEFANVQFITNADTKQDVHRLVSEH